MRVRFLIRVLPIPALLGCAGLDKCPYEALAKEESMALDEVIRLNGLDPSRTDQYGNHLDVDGCPTGHITQISMSGLGIDTLPPGIATFGHATQILLDDNDLKGLPIEITRLNPLLFSIRENRLCDVPDTIATWLDARNSSWRASQRCVSR